jgi:hypothetical protein
MFIIYPVHVLTASNGFVVLLFVPYKKGDHQAADDANGKACDVNERESFVTPQVPQGCFQIIFKHAVVCLNVMHGVLKKFMLAYSVRKFLTGLVKAARIA